MALFRVRSMIVKGIALAKRMRLDKFYKKVSCEERVDGFAFIMHGLIINKNGNT